MKITDSEFKEIVFFMKSNYGINLSAKRTLVAGRLENFLIQNGYKSYQEYIDKVKGDKSGKEAKTLINYLTTNHTYFWREPVHFEFMKNVALPQLAQREQRSKSLRIWSAASSTGEEPYTIIMVLKEFFKLQRGWDTRILATDISTRALDKAKNGIYLKEQLESLPNNWGRTYFESYSEEECRVKTEIRNEATFRSLNLMEPFPFRYKFHIIFLRNVMIYFEEETKRKLVNKMYDVLDDGGYLFIGSTEMINKSATKLKYIQPSIYQKV